MQPRFKEREPIQEVNGTDNTYTYENPIDRLHDFIHIDILFYRVSIRFPFRTLSK